MRVVKTHLDYVYDHEAERPDAVWLVQPMGDGTLRELTWRTAIDEARRMAAYLRGLDLPARSQIAIFAKNNAWWFLSDLAIWMAGHVSVPLYATLAPDTIRKVLEHSESRAIFIGKLDGFAAMEAGIPTDLRRIAMPLAPAGGGEPWHDIIANTPPLGGKPSRDPDELATIVYTSGSTGMPKGVMHSFRTMAAALVFTERLHGSVDDRVLSYLPLAHVYERAVIETCGFKTGARVYFAENLDTFVADLRRARPTLFVSVPRLWLKFQQAVFEKLPPAALDKLLADPTTRDLVRKQVLEGLGLAEVRHAATGSAPIPEKLLHWYRDLGLDLFEGYAMTENFCVSHATKQGEVRVGYVGTPVEGVEQRIAEDGEVLVKSPGTMLGYYNAKELTDEVLGADGFLHTGDRGELDEVGRLKITGRAKEIFKTSKGKYVAPAPIENLLLQHEAIEQALVSGSNMPQPFALVVIAEAIRPKLAQLKDALATALAEHLARVNAKLDPHEHLEKLVVVTQPWTIENGMLTPTMKVRRSVIEAHYAPNVEGWYADAASVVWS
jgi:long-subunit acyl-CoA synthetase (AMP-forming)